MPDDFTPTSDDFTPIKGDFIPMGDDFTPIKKDTEIGKGIETAFGKTEEIRRAPTWPEKLLVSVKRKHALLTKAGAKGLTFGYATPEKISYAYPEEYRKQFLKTEPYTPIERVLTGTAETGYSLLPLAVGAEAVGLGKVGLGGAALTRPQLVARTAALGGLLGGLEKPAEEEVAAYGQWGAKGRKALSGATIFAGFTAGAMGLQTILSQYSQAHLKDVLVKATSVVEKIAPKMEQLDTIGAQQILQSLSPYERNTVFNILRGKWGMPQKVWKGWFERTIGEPVYNKLINRLERIMPESIKERFIYRYGQPEEYARIAEQRVKNISLWQEKAEQAGKLVTEGISQAESKLILMALKEPTQLEVLRTMNPILYNRALQARNIINEGSIQLAKIETLPEETRKTILENLGSYVKRVYETPEEKKKLFKFFTGRRTIREPRIYERGKIARKMYEDPLKKELGDITDEIQHIDDIAQIEGIGGIANVRLKRAGLGRLEALANADPSEINKILVKTPDNDIGISIISQADSMSRYKASLIQRQNEINNLIKKPLIKPDIPVEVRKRLGEITTAGYPVGRSIQDMGYKIETARLFESVAKNPLFSTTNRTMAKKAGWIQMSDSKQMGSLRDMWVSPSIANDINGITKSIEKSDRVYRDLLSAWKMGKTTLNPATHGRNIMSNTILLEMSGVPSHRIPDLLSASIDDIAKNTQMYQRFKQAGLGLGTFKTAEIDALKGIYTGKSSISGMLESAGKGLEKKFLGNLGRLYQLEEELFKIAKGRYLLEQGFNVPNAFKEAEKWLFNYNKIPEFIRKVRTHPFGAPFITFQYKAFPRVLEALIKRPMTVIKYPLLMGVMEQYAIKKFNLTPDQVAIIKKDKPLTYILPITDKHGNIRIFNLQYIVPYGEVFEKRKVAGWEVPTFGLMQNPMYSTPYNILKLNRDAFTGKEIISEDASETKKAKQVFKYLGNQLLPPLTPGIGYPAESIRKAIEGRSDRYGIKTDYWWEIIGNITGLKTQPINVDVETYKKMKWSSGLWRRYDIRQSVIMKDMGITDEERLFKLKELQEERIRGFNKIWEDIIQETETIEKTDDFTPTKKRFFL